MIDSGSDINCIHPDVVKRLGIHTEKIGKPFSVSGLGHSILTVSKETEKCILRFKNHLEIIQLNVLRIPDVDVILGLPWILNTAQAIIMTRQKLHLVPVSALVTATMVKEKETTKRNKVKKIKCYS